MWNQLHGLVFRPANISSRSLDSKKKITELFDFNSTEWLSRHAHFADITFEEELESYELLDLYADGDIDQDFDTATQANLSNRINTMNFGLNCTNMNI